jgi:hypothetical protein
VAAVDDRMTVGLGDGTDRALGLADRRTMVRGMRVREGLRSEHEGEQRDTQNLADRAA